MTIKSSEPNYPGLIDRRGLLRSVGAGVATTAITGTVGTAGLIIGSAPARAAGFTDNDYIAFFSNFEALGANYYLYGLTGQGVPAALTTGSGILGVVSAGGPVSFQSAAVAQYVQRLAVDELAHLEFFRALLGSAAVAQPTVNIASSWTNFAIGAGLITPGQTFNPYENDVTFLLGAYMIEDVCVTAAAGAARYLTNKDTIEAAAGILGAEGYHAGAIRTLLSNIGAGQATDAISNLRASLSGIADNGTLISGQAYNFTNTDSDALVYRRTPAQALAILYDGNLAGGGFFPNGLNGLIR